MQKAKPADILYDFLASQELKDTLNEEVPYQKSQDKREGPKNFEKPEHWGKDRETFLEDGTTYLTNVCRKMAKNQKRKNNKMKPPANHSHSLLTDGSEPGNSSGYSTKRQKRKSKTAQKKERKEFKAQQTHERKWAKNMKIRAAKEREFKVKLDEEKEKIAAIQEAKKAKEIRVGPIPDSNDIGEMFAKANMEHINQLRKFEQRAEENKRAAERKDMEWSLEQEILLELEQNDPMDTEIRQQLWNQLLELEAAMEERNARIKQEYKIGPGHYELVKRNDEIEKENEESVTVPEKKSVKERFEGNEVMHDVDVMYLFPLPQQTFSKNIAPNK
jgi:hypothetical protein